MRSFTILFALPCALALVAAPCTADTVEEPRGDVGFADALAAALLGNPELASIRLQVRIEDARALQAGLLPNPVLGTEAEDVAGTGARSGWQSGQTTVGVTQLLELGGQRSKRRRTAELERELASFDYDARRLDVLAEVAKGVAETLAAQDRLALARELEALAARSAGTVAATVRAGAVSPVEETRARVAEGRAATDRLAAERDLVTARARLAATWGSTEARFERVVGDLRTIATPESLDVLLARLRNNPDLARWNAERTHREAALAFERSRRIPDVTVNAGGRHYADHDDGALVFGFSVPLPVLDRNQGNIAAAEIALTRIERERRAAEIAVTTALRTAYESLRAAFAQATALRERVIPEAERTYAGARDAYTRGLFRYLEVLDAQRTLFELRGQYLETLRQYHDAAADLTRLTGEPPSALPATEGRTGR